MSTLKKKTRFKFYRIKHLGYQINAFKSVCVLSLVKQRLQR